MRSGTRYSNIIDIMKPIHNIGTAVQTRGAHKVSNVRFLMRGISYGVEKHKLHELADMCKEIKYGA